MSASRQHCYVFFGCDCAGWKTGLFCHAGLIGAVKSNGCLQDKNPSGDVPEQKKIVAASTFIVVWRSAAGIHEIRRSRIGKGRMPLP